MITLTVNRFDRTDLATYGFITTDASKQLAVTLELPWRANAHDVSCIPPGTYTAVRFPAGAGKRPYDVFKLTDVPGRADIELHIGNTTADTDGCILLGTKFGTVNGQRGIVDSRDAFNHFMDVLHGVDTFALVVVDPKPEPIDASEVSHAA